MQQAFQAHERAMRPIGPVELVLSVSGMNFLHGTLTSLQELISRHVVSKCRQSRPEYRLVPATNDEINTTVNATVGIIFGQISVESGEI